MFEHRQPLLIAHRFGNRVDSVAPSVRAGARLIEIDVWFHRGRIEVGHDKTLGPIPLRWDRWSLALGWRRKVRLPDVLAQVPPQVAPMFDLKGSHPRLPEALKQIIEEHIPGRPFFVSSQNWAYLEEFLDHEQAQVVRSVGSHEALEQMRGALDSWTGAGIGLHVELLTPSVIDELLEGTPLILTWTINDIGRAKTLLDAGVRGIISDNLELIREISEGIEE